MEIKEWIRCHWRVFGGWVIVGGYLPLGLWWYCQTPTPGKGGALLALVATVMPLVWEDLRPIGKAGLILTLVILFAVEYRAIDKEHKDYAGEQSKARREDRESFQRLLDKQEESVSRMLEREDHHFKDTFHEFLEEDKHENARFYALLGKQEVTFNRQEELAESLSGKLVPGSDPTPAKGCRQSSDQSVLVFLGEEKSHNAVLVDQFPHIVLALGNLSPAIRLERSIDGAIIVDLDIRSHDGKIITRLNKDGFVVNRNNFLEMKKDRQGHSLVIIDDYGNEVLNVQYINPRAIRIRGLLNFPDRAPVALRLPNEQYSCSAHAGFADIVIN